MNPDTTPLATFLEDQEETVRASDTYVFGISKTEYLQLLALARWALEAREAMEDVRYSYDRCRDKGLGNKAIDAWEYATGKAREAFSTFPKLP